MAEEKIHPGVVIVGGLGLGLAGALVMYALARAAPPPGAEFEVSDLVISPLEVQIGNPVQISCLVENIGTESGSKTVILEVNGEMAEQIVTLAPGESEVVTFEVTPEVAKTYSVSVDGLYSSFEATEEGVAVFSVVVGASNMTPEVGEVIQWWADITNIGAISGTALVTYFRDGYILPYTHSITVNPGKTRRTYGSSFGFATPGDHVLTIVADSASDSLTITVGEVAEADIRIENLAITPTDPMVGETVIISVTATNYGTATGSKTIVCTVS